MSKKEKKYYVRWQETHEAEVVAKNEKEALKKAHQVSSRKNIDTTEDGIAIAA